MQLHRSPALQHHYQRKASSQAGTGDSNVSTNSNCQQALWSSQTMHVTPCLLHKMPISSHAEQPLLSVNSLKRLACWTPALPISNVQDSCMAQHTATHTITTAEALAMQNLQDSSSHSHVHQEQRYPPNGSSTPHTALLASPIGTTPNCMCAYMGPASQDPTTNKVAQLVCSFRADLGSAQLLQRFSAPSELPAAQPPTGLQVWRRRPVRAQPWRRSCVAHGA